MARDMRTSRGACRSIRANLSVKWAKHLPAASYVAGVALILARRHRTRYGEIDIIAREGETIVFIEVKARRDVAFGGAGAAVTMWKQRRIVRMASDYLARHGLLEAPCRFDVVAIDFDEGRPHRGLQARVHRVTNLANLSEPEPERDLYPVAEP